MKLLYHGIGGKKKLSICIVLKHTLNLFTNQIKDKKNCVVQKLKI